MNFVDSREWFPLHPFDLFKTKPAATLKYISNDRQRFFNAFDLFQTLDVLGAKVSRGPNYLHRSWPRKNDLGTHICCAPLEIV